METIDLRIRFPEPNDRSDRMFAKQVETSKSRAVQVRAEPPWLQHELEDIKAKNLNLTFSSLAI